VPSTHAPSEARRTLTPSSLCKCRPVEEEHEHEDIMGGLLGGDDDDFEDEEEEEEEEAVEKGEEQVCARVQPCRHTRALQLPQVFCERAVAPLHRPAAAFTAGSAPFAQASLPLTPECLPTALPAPAEGGQGWHAVRAGAAGGLRHGCCRWGREGVLRGMMRGAWCVPSTARAGRPRGRLLASTVCISAKQPPQDCSAAAEGKGACACPEPATVRATTLSVHARPLRWPR